MEDEKEQLQKRIDRMQKKVLMITHLMTWVLKSESLRHAILCLEGSTTYTVAAFLECCQTLLQ